MMGPLGLIGTLVTTVVDRFSPEKSKVVEGQNRANEAEIANAPMSHLRLWRSFLGWVLAAVFAWEVVGRGIVLTYWPDTKLPPSVLQDIMTLLLGMLGLGW
ncbi:MAG: hypothetical protein RRY29_11290 [Desulfovibrionaceae bacterium]